ncbi:MAG: hypothetical protein AAFV29_14945 [Myxococcota bacterium]
MMRSQDLAHVAKRAPALQNMVILAVPGGQLVNQWPSSTTDTASLASIVAELLGAAGRATRWGLSAAPTMIAVESEAGPLIVCPLGEGFGAGFFFNASTSLGLARIQIRDIVLALDPQSLEPTSKPPAAVPITASLPSADFPSIMAPPTSAATSSLPIDPMMPPPSSTAETITPFSSPVESHLRSSPPTASTTRSSPPMASTTRSSPPAESVTRSSSPPESTGSSSLPDTPSRPPIARPRAALLLEQFQRHAPDPHICLLRLSLRTGITLEKLERPEQLTPDQVDSIAASIRDIVGRDDFGA